MKPKNLQKVAQENGKIYTLDQKDDSKLELQKAAAQAWHNHLYKAKVATSEFDALKMNFQTKPSRFKLEAMNKVKANEQAERAKLEFYHSLWDSYEIVAVSKRLETGLMFDYMLEDVKRIGDVYKRMWKRRESKNSLRKLFSMVPIRSRRLSEDGILHRGISDVRV